MRAVPVAALAVLLGILLVWINSDTGDSQAQCRMAPDGETERDMARFKAENHSAFVVGYTGEIGKALVRDLSKLQIFKRVVLMGRRQVELDVGPGIEQKIVNFDKLDEHADLFTGLDVGFCCLGTTRGKAGKEGFVKVDRDYVLATARVSKAQGCRQFGLISSTGADVNSFMLYSKTKGEAEAGVTQIGFERLSIYRPGALLCKREEFRLGERILYVLLAPVFYLFPTSLSIPVESVARAMVNHVVAPLGGSGPQTSIYFNKETHEASGLHPRGCAK
ncbi:hypothetical protein EGW08_016429 [Elysia chlorotica]|uniref:NAD(P)-binding domain-containing protein n=1 Tax=Elysia chlorotica TaxID=188477 RepID=A0A433T2M7_ELYCH|nr:hypothetical protein EGW08_016429 [Elysia chlorotica]